MPGRVLGHHHDADQDLGHLHFLEVRPVRTLLSINPPVHIGDVQDLGRPSLGGGNRGPAWVAGAVRLSPVYAAVLSPTECEAESSRRVDPGHGDDVARAL